MWRAAVVAQSQGFILSPLFSNVFFQLALLLFSAGI